MCWRSGNPPLIFLHSYHVWVTSTIQKDFRFNTYSEVLVNVSYRFQNCFTIHVFEVRQSIATELICLSDLENLVQLPSDSRVTQRYWWSNFMGLSQFLHCLCCQGQFMVDIPTELPCLSDLKNPSQLPVREVLVILSYKLLKFWTNEPFNHVLRSGNPLLIFLQSYHVWGYLKNPGRFPVQQVLGGTGDVSCRFWKFLQYLRFWGQRIICWHSYWSTILRGPWKCRTTSGSSGFLGYPKFVLWLKKCSEFISSRAKDAGRSHDQCFIANWLYPHAKNSN